MNAIVAKSDGLFARRKTMNKIKTRSLFSLLLTSSLIVFSCQEKTNGQELADAKKEKNIVQDSVNRPKVSITVNRHYDDKGNVIGFDSTYSSFYSNVQGDTAKMDSLFSNFNRYFDRNQSFFFRDNFNSLFFNDSLLYPDFFHKDFFMKRYELNDAYLKDMMRRMDSIKNNFYREQSRKDKNSTDL